LPARNAPFPRSSQEPPHKLAATVHGAREGTPSRVRVTPTRGSASDSASVWGSASQLVSESVWASESGSQSASALESAWESDSQSASVWASV